MSYPLSTALRTAVEALLAGTLSPAMAYTRLCMESRDSADLSAALAMATDAAPANPAVAELAALALAHPNALEAIRKTLDAVSHDKPGSLGETAAMFDAAADYSPEAAVALHSLGDPDRLTALTAEIVAHLDRLSVLSPDRSLLEIGCGIGRFLKDLAPRLASLTGIDISSRMVEIARERLKLEPNVTVEIGSGDDLSTFAAASVDIVLAVDCFPYLVQVGPDLAARTIAESARILAPGGDLVIFNWSYRNDFPADSADFATACRSAGLAALVVGDRPFTLWDGTLFHARRPVAGQAIASSEAPGGRS